MERLHVRSPGTIYPVLELLRERGLVDYTFQTVGTSRRKVYSLTKNGAQQLSEQLARSAKYFCCNPSLHMGRILESVKELVEIKHNQKILCTLEYDEVKTLLRNADVTYSNDLNVQQGKFDLALSFLGVGILTGNEDSNIAKLVGRLYGSLRKGGLILAIEIEKSDNIFARIIFEDMMGLKETPGLSKEELRKILQNGGFKDTSVTDKSGLLYGLARK